MAVLFQQKWKSFPGILGPVNPLGKCHIDLWEINRRQLLAVGIREEYIEVAGLCTKCHSEEFFSYRRSGNDAGRFGAGIMLLGDNEGE